MASLSLVLRGEWRTLKAGAGLRDRAQLARVLAHAHLHLGRRRHWFTRLSQGDVGERPIRLRSGLEVLVAPDDAVAVLEHVGLDVYDLPLGVEEPRVIVDLGANVGLAALMLARRHPQARLICVEPTPASRERLIRNLERNGVVAEVLGVAVVGKAGRSSLRTRHFSGGNTFVEQPDGEVEGVSLAALLDRLGVDTVDLLKIDVEGAEAGIFAHADAWAPRVAAIVGELHGDFTMDDASRLLAPHGFRSVPDPLRLSAAWVKR